MAEAATCTSTWAVYSTTVGPLAWAVDIDGTKTLSVKFRDAAGNETACLSKSIVYDKTAPVAGAFQINGGAARTRDRNVTLGIAVSGATEMQISESTVFNGAWQPVTSAASYTLSSGDGGKTLNIIYRDAAGNTAQATPAIIQLDTVAPSGTISAPALVSSLTIPLTLTSNDATARVDLADNPGFVNAASFAYQAATSYTLAVALDGLRTIYARLVDPAGNVSALLAAMVQVDTTAPQLAAFSIRQGALTNSRTVDLDLTALDAAEMSVTEAGACSSIWITFAATRTHMFAADVDGVKTLAVKFRDTAGNQTACLTKSITYDKTPPVPGAFSIDGGASYARSRNVDLSLASSGASEMQISETAVFSGAWLPVTTSVSYTLSAGDDTKTLYVLFRDAAGNTAQATPASISLDTVGPEQPLVTVNDGSGYARQITAALTLSATGTPSHYRWTVDGIIDNKPWLTIVASTSVSLGAGADGARSVAVQFKDMAGNLSLAAQAAVYLDRETPSAPLLRVDDGAATTRSSSGLVTLTLNAADTGSGLEKVRLAPTQAGLGAATPLPFEPTKVYTLDNYTFDGIKQVWASFYDKAGNYSAPISAAIKLDRTPPSGVLSLPLGTLSSTIIVPVTIAADADTAEMLLSNDPAFTGAAWQPFTSTVTWIFAAVEGSQTLHARFRDAAGNTSLGVSTVDADIDLSAPSVASVSGTSVSDTLVWDHYGAGVSGYSVVLYNNGTVVSVTNTTEKRLAVGKLAPGFTVIAHFGGGGSSNASFAPGYDVPVTPAAFIGLQMDSAQNKLVGRLATQYGLGTTTSGCGQITFSNRQGGDFWESTDPCGKGSSVRVPYYSGWNNAPPFEAIIESGAENPFAGLAPLRVGGVGVSYSYDSGGLTRWVKTPAPVSWPTSQYNSIYNTMSVISSRSYDPAAASGSNMFQFDVDLHGLAIADDVTFSTGAFTGQLDDLPALEPGIFSLGATGVFAGIPVTEVTVMEPSWETSFSFNRLWDGFLDYSRYTNGVYPGTLRLSGYVTNGYVQGSTMRLGNSYPYCYWDWMTEEYTCQVYGTQYDVDTASGTIAARHNDPNGWYYSSDIVVANRDGTRSYRFPVARNATSTFQWTAESDQAAFLDYLRVILKKLATPTRVRATGKPVLRSNVPEAVDMQVSTNATFTGANWETYAATVTLAEGITTVWVRYRDPAGNITQGEQVVISAPLTGPRLDFAGMAGPGAEPGYTTVRDVKALLIGSFEPGIRARISTSPAFSDSGWVSVADVKSSFDYLDPYTGAPRTLELGQGRRIGQLDFTVAEAPPQQRYYAWLADDSGNFSNVAPIDILIDGSAPQSEFSVRAQYAGSMQYQARWNVSVSTYAPALTLTTPSVLGAYTLPFVVPYLSGSSNALVIDSGKKACFTLGSLKGCPLKNLRGVPTHEIYFTAQQALVIWKTEDAYGQPITAAATVFPTGKVRLSYWTTRAKTLMAGHVDEVDTPYSDWRYAIAQGSVEYTPNTQEIELVLRGDDGSLVRRSYDPENGGGGGCPAGTCSGAWFNASITSTGTVTYIGTAFSKAGAPGRITTRKITLPGPSSTSQPETRQVPLTDNRHWVGWDQPTNGTGASAWIDGMQLGASPVIGGANRAGVSIQQGYENASQYLANVSLKHAHGLYRTASLASSGTPLSYDETNQLIYGDDGSLWDARDPARPVALRVFDGAYPYPRVGAARVGNVLWSPGGIYDVSTPATPWLWMADPLNGITRLAYGNYIYAIDGSLRVFDGTSPWSPALNTVSPMNSMSNEPFIRGNKLYSINYGQINVVDLADPLNPIELPSIPITTNGTYQHLVAGEIFETYNRSGVAGATSYLLIDTTLARSYSGDTGADMSMRPADSKRVDLPGTGVSVDASGPYVRAVHAAGFEVYSPARSLPPAAGQHTSGQVSALGFDDRYTYVCGTNGLMVVDSAGATVARLTSPNCPYLGALQVNYPYVFDNYSRYRVSGELLVADKQEVCVDMGGYTWCQEVRKLGTIYGTYDGTYLPSLRQVTFSDTRCRPLYGFADLILCKIDGEKKIRATTYSSYAYNGIVTGETVLPLTLIIDDDTEFISAAEGYVSTYAATYRVDGLAKVTVVGPGNMIVYANGFAFRNADNTLYKLGDSSAVPVAVFTADQDFAGVSGAGRLVAGGYDGFSTYAWGPGSPELRVTDTTLVNPVGMVTAGGFVFVANATGLHRLRPLTRAAKFKTSRTDVIIDHAPGEWIIRNRALEIVSRVTEPTPGTVDNLCQNLLRYDNGSTSELCTKLADLNTDRVFLGGLGEDWLAYQGYESDNIGTVTALVAGGTGMVFAAAGTEVFAYDATLGALAPRFTISASDMVQTLEATPNGLYVVTADNLLTKYQLVPSPAVLWQVPIYGAESKVRVLGDSVAVMRSDMWGSWSLDLLDPSTGAISTQCWVGGPYQDFAITKIKWSGTDHVVAMIAQDSTLTMHPMEGYCNQSANWYMDAFASPAPYDIGRVSIQDGMIAMGVEAKGVALFKMNGFTRPEVATLLYGPLPGAQVEILGEHAYTVGPTGLQIFTLH